jgi:hypothetical protein
MELKFKAPPKRDSNGYICIDGETREDIFSWIKSIKQSDFVNLTATHIRKLEQNEAYIMSLGKKDLRTIIRSLTTMVQVLNTYLDPNISEGDIVEIRTMYCVLVGVMKAIENAE